MQEGRKQHKGEQHLSTSTDERRRHRRFLEEVRVRYRDLEGVGPAMWGQTRDLSLGGVCLMTPEPIPVGSHLALEVHVLQETAPILALGRVVRGLDELGDGSFAGIEFLWISEDDRKNLDRLAKFFEDKYGETGEF